MKNPKDCHCFEKQKLKTYSILEVEVKPEFPGGETELLKCLVQNIHFNNVDSMDLFRSSFYIRFTIDTNGKSKNICILNPEYQDRLTNIEIEILKAVEQIPLWKPAIHKGKKVATEMMVPFCVHRQ